MSEFKYACPVCGQHIICDSSQAGTVMDCPTCFQQVTVPQAPADQDQKLILTGTQVGEKRPTTLAEAATDSPKPSKPFPVAAVLFILALALAAGAGLYFSSGHISRWLGHWQALDVGNVNIPGSFNRSGTAWNVAGSGDDIWNRGDAFHFVCRPAGSDANLSARVVSLQNTHIWAKAGLMVRESLAPDSAFAMVVVTSSNGVAFQQRSSAGGEATTIRVVPTVRAPCWVRLARQNNVFTADYSADGQSWTSLGSATIQMQPDTWAGLAVTAHNASALCEASFDQFNFKSGGRAKPAAPPASGE